MKWRVLVVEDDDDVATTMAELLTEEGFDVTIARTGREGLDRLEGDEAYCLVLLDFRMPDMGGREFVRTVRTDAEQRHTPVVLVTGADASMIGDAGVPVVHKPVACDQLMDVVRDQCPRAPRGYGVLPPYA